MSDSTSDKKTDFTFQDRRRGVRHVVHERYSVTLVELDDTGAAIAEKPVVEGHVTDVGGGGMGVIVNQQLVAGAHYLATIRGTTTDGQLRCQTAWSSRLSTGGKVLKANPQQSWRAGLVFVPDSADNPALIEEIISNIA